MKVLFTASRITDQLGFYIDMLTGLNDEPDVTIAFNRDDFENHDVLLLMGVDPPVREARRRNPRARVGVVDPRRYEGETLEADFAIVQGLEQENWFSDYYLDLFRYDFHPVGPCLPRTHLDVSPIVIGYHGNKVHLHTMFPAVTTALEQLAGEMAVELRAYFDIETHGELDHELLPRGVRVEQRQWRWDVFDDEFDEIDIGIVPNTIPIGQPQRARRAAVTAQPLFNQHETDYLLRFKGTSNAARAYPFARRGIPVVADLYPSACHFIEHGVSGMLGGSAGMWYRSLRELACSAQRREAMGRRLMRAYQHTMTPEALNPRLAAFLREVCGREPRAAPPAFQNASSRLQGRGFRRATARERRRRRGS